MISLSKVINHEHMLDICKEFSRLRDKCYLENAGTALYPASLFQRVNEDLLNNVYMNPHSDKYTKDCVEQIRCLILKHFNTNPSNYTVIFTSGTTQSLKSVLESFQFNCQEDELNQGSFMYLSENHTSVIGLRELAKEKNVDVIHISQEEFLKSVKTVPKSTGVQLESKKGNSLIAYPAQNNFNGYKFPLDCIENIKNGCLNSYLKKQLCATNCNWYVLLDAASYVSTNMLDLSVHQPDFVCLSFYKVFGYPTGLGALIVNNKAISVLSEKKYFGGGTVDIVLSNEDFHVKRESLYERFEDGTISFLSIIALKHCYDTLYSLIPKVVNNDVMETVSHHTFYLAQDLYTQLCKLKHENGMMAAVLYVDSDFTDVQTQGAIVTFNLKRNDGSFIGYAEFQHMADLFNISVRTGCFCNAGTCQRHLNLTNKSMKAMYKAGHKCGDDLDLVNGKPTGAIRVSFGYYNTYHDVDKLMNMICKCFVNTKVEKPQRTLNIYKNIQQAHKSMSIYDRKFEDCLDDGTYININNNTTYTFNPEMLLTEIAIFPIKSCGAFKIKSAWKIGPKGFEYDREWMVVKDNGVCLTQKQCPEMCTIRPEINLESKCLILHCHDMPSITIPLDQKKKNGYQESSLCRSKVCTDIIKGFDCGDEAADWVSNALGISFLRLIQQSSDDNRTLKKKSEDGSKLLSLSNQAQFLLINRATVNWLRGKIQDPLFDDDLESLTDRFRGNIIIDTSKELIEKEWKKVIIGDHEFNVDGQCPRCQMVCIDQKTGQKTVEPLRTISEQFGGKLKFGVYLSYVGTVNSSLSSSLNIFSEVTPINDAISYNIE
ncbi:molybdenum cofactor sulfurase isoform X2 [Colias croceus]|nr:molybdenum cofactor sulfurase isoform X2 [Colias croceus]